MSKAVPSPLARARWAVLGLAFLMSGCDLLPFPSIFDSGPTGTSVLTLLDTDRRSLEIGSEELGALSSSDYVGVNGSYLEAWKLRARAGQSLSIDLVSDDFDSYLYVVGPGLSQALSDDDGGGACHARLNFSVLESGVFHVVASSSSGSTTGTYTLRVSAEPGPRVAMSCGGVNGFSLTGLPTEGRELTRGAPATGYMSGAEPSIENDRPVQAWSFRADAGQRATIRLESDDYDAYLYLFGPGMAETMTNDDGAGDLNSELTVTFPEAGVYTIGAGALSSGAVGSYVLSVVDPIDLATMATGERVLYIDSEAYGILQSTDPVVEGKHVQAWALEARAGDRATIDQISEDFDSYLWLAGPGLSTPLSNDDGGDGLHSRLEVTFPQDGVYRVIASSLGRSTGSYTLLVR